MSLGSGVGQLYVHQNRILGMRIHIKWEGQERVEPGFKEVYRGGGGYKTVSMPYRGVWGLSPRKNFRSSEIDSSAI